MLTGENLTDFAARDNCAVQPWGAHEKLVNKINEVNGGTGVPERVIRVDAMISAGPDLNFRSAEGVRELKSMHSL